MTEQTETARALLWRHNLPEDVIDGALCLHAQELAAVQREAISKTDDPVFYEGEAGWLINLIEPDGTEPAVSSAVPAPATDRVRAVCDQLHRAAVLADGEPRTDRERGIVQAVTRIRAALDDPAAVLPAPTDQAAVPRTFEALYDAVVQIIIDDYTSSDCVDEARLRTACLQILDAGKAAGCRVAAESGADRAAVLLEAADHIDGMDLPQDFVDMFDNGARWATAELRRRAAELRCLAGEAQQDEAPCCSDPTCACDQVNADGICDCVKWDTTPAGEAQQDRCPTPESHNWGCGCPTDQLPLHAESGVDTPGCDCGHQGMGPKWHARACDWLATMTVPHPDTVAREAQQDPTQDGTAAEAHPPEHTWAAELYDPLPDEWVPSTRYTVRERAVNHLDHANAIGSTWKDGTPVQRRLVRATTTYTVEDDAAVARPGQPDTDGETVASDD